MKTDVTVPCYYRNSLRSSAEFKLLFVLRHLRTKVHTAIYNDHPEAPRNNIKQYAHLSGLFYTINLMADASSKSSALNLPIPERLILFCFFSLSLFFLQRLLILSMQMVVVTFPRSRQYSGGGYLVGRDGRHLFLVSRFSFYIPLNKKKTFTLLNRTPPKVRFILTRVCVCKCVYNRESAQQIDFLSNRERKGCFSFSLFLIFFPSNLTRIVLSTSFVQSLIQRP